MRNDPQYCGKGSDSAKSRAQASFGTCTYQASQCQVCGHSFLCGPAQGPRGWRAKRLFHQQDPLEAEEGLACHQLAWVLALMIKEIKAKAVNLKV